MLTVKELKSELLKFKDDDLCYAYEGEVVGLVINRGNEQGVIYCGEYEKETRETEVIIEEIMNE